MKPLLLAPLLFLFSCKPTESINSFAHSAAAATRDVHSTTPGFGDFCRLYSPEALRRQADTTLLAAGPHARVICKEYKASDTLVRVLELGLLNYFSLLEAASDKKLLAYNTRDLVASLDDLHDQVLPSLEITQEKVSAIRGILNAVLNEPLKIYRDAKLKTVIRQNDSAVSRVVGTYIFILDSALLGEMDQAEANYKTFVYLPLYEWAHGPADKAFINDRYNAFIDGLANERGIIRKSARVLETLRKDHHLLAAAQTKPDFRAAADNLAADVALVQELVEEIKVLSH